MSRVSWRRLSVTLLLVSVLGAPPVLATGLPSAAVEPSRVGQFAVSHLRDRLLAFLRTVTGETGCNVDPNGHCVPATPPPSGQTDTGCNVDPNGHCIPGTARPPVRPSGG